MFSASKAFSFQPPNFIEKQKNPFFQNLIFAFSFSAYQYILFPSRFERESARGCGSEGWVVMRIKEGDDNDEICDRLAVDKTEKKKPRKTI